VLDEGKSVTAVARELDLIASALGQWVKHAQADRSKGRSGLTTAEREELARLRKENRILTEERDILRNRHAFFTKHSRYDPGSSRRSGPTTILQTSGRSNIHREIGR
jgi:transposase